MDNFLYQKQNFHIIHRYHYHLVGVQKMLNEWFGLSSTASTLIIVGILLGIMVVIFIVQWRKTKRTPMGRVLSVQGNIRSNTQICKRFQKKNVIKRLKTEDWVEYQSNIDFLPEELRKDLAGYFQIVWEVNQQIDATVSNQLENQAVYVEISKLQEVQSDIMRRLDKWIYANFNNPNYMPRKKGWFRF